MRSGTGWGGEESNHRHYSGTELSLAVLQQDMVAGVLGVSAVGHKGGEVHKAWGFGSQWKEFRS